MTIKFDNLGARIDKTIDETIQKAVKDLKHDFIEAMRNDLMKLPYSYKGFPSDRTKYIKRDDVMKIFEKYTEGESKDADSD